MGATFDIRRLLYFNKRLLIKKFIKSHESFKPQLFEEFRGYFYKIFPKHVAKMKQWDHENWRKIIYLIIVSNLFNLKS